MAPLPRVGLGGVRLGHDPRGGGARGRERYTRGRGRNRVYEADAPAPQIARSLLAHAEVNALVGLDPERRYEDHVLYTSLEPCVLCVGATVMATVGRVRFADADPYGGGQVGSNPHVERVPLQLEGPREDAIGVLASALLPAFYLSRNPRGAVIAAYERTYRTGSRSLGGSSTKVSPSWRRNAFHFPPRSRASGPP